MKILIWDKDTRLLNTGGPSGYLYNIHEYLKNNSSDEVYFYSDIIEKDNTSKENIIKEDNWISKIFFRHSSLKFIYTLFSAFFRSKKLNPTEIKLINRFDYVHFHWLSEVLKYHRSLEKTNAKIILTTHTPEPLIDEVIHNSGKKLYILQSNLIRNIFIKREIKAFEYVDYIMFPSKYSSEVYTNVSILYKKAFVKLNKKFFYVPTAITDISTEKKYSKFIKNKIDDLNVCYIGRHNEIKGYDKLKKIAIEVWKEISNIHFYIGGKEGPLYGLDDFRWHELGWVNTYDLLHDIDVFILPNKETYYDLILLEVLKSGKPVILTRTGGNKQFIDYVPNTGLFYYDYDDINSAVEQIKKVFKLKNEGYLDKIGHDNFILFKKTSCQSVYMKNYIEKIKLLEYR